MKTKQETIDYCEEQIQGRVNPFAIPQLCAECHQNMSPFINEVVVGAYRNVIDFLEEKNETTETTLVG